jgi:hypothetical protein
VHSCRYTCSIVCHLLYNLQFSQHMRTKMKFWEYGGAL